MDYGKHFVTTLVCFVKGKGLLSGGYCQGGSRPGGAYVLHPISTISVAKTVKVWTADSAIVKIPGRF